MIADPKPNQPVRVVQIVGWLAILLCSGCQFAPSPSNIRWPWSEKKPAPQPDRVLAVWTDTVLHQPNQPGVRGFGGRVYFYEEGGSDPIEVNGGLAVYVFDADQLQAHDQRPLRKFVFTTEQFATHMSRTSLGPSYSVWLPWGEVGGPPQRLSLIARFEAAEGGTTISEPTIKLLPGIPVRGVSSEQELAQQRSSSPFQLTGHATAVDSTQDEAADASSSGKKQSSLTPRQRDIKTIDLPPSFQRHLQQTGEPEVSQGGQALDSKTPTHNALSPLMTSDAAAALIPLDSQSLQTLAATSAVAPPTTQVIDHRSRQQWSRANQSQTSPRVDIREGKWIESLPRIGQ